MRSDTLLFFHVFSAMLLLGAATTVTTLLVATARRPGEVPRAELLLRLAFRLNLFVTIPSTVAAIAFGEGLKAKEDAAGNWLAVGIGLTYVVVLVGALVLHGFVRRGIAATALGTPPSASTLRGAASIAPAMVAAVLVIAFLMSGKPG
jgi:uncharacterized membrane protein